MSQSISLWGATYSNVPAVQLPKSPSGTATFTDVTDTTATASDVASGKYFYTAAGVKTAGTGSGGGGGSDVTFDMKDAVLSSASNSITFTGLSGEPTSFSIIAGFDLATGASPWKTAMVVYDGTNVIGQTITNTNNAQVSYDGTGFSQSYSNGTLTVTGTGTQFQVGMYSLYYTFGGTAGNIKTADVQVGSGATSITFTGLEDEPIYFSCIFKSNFSTSSGYQRVIGIATSDQEGEYIGLEMDSGAHISYSHWTLAYSNGSLTITSQGTNAGGYFHQPGYYQLTYAVSGDQSLQTKTVYASTSQQNITADEGYTGLSKVVVGAVSQTNLIAGNIKNGTTVSISNGDSNLWSVTGTYTGGGGGSSMNVQTNQTTSRTTSTTLASVNSLTCSTAGTYDVYWTCTRSSTSGTWSSQLYVGGTASGSEQTTWSNHVQTVKLTGVTIAANQTVAVYAKSRGSNYYAYAPQLTIVQTS